MEPNERGRSAFSGPGRELSPTGGVRAQSTRDGQIRTSTRYGTQCWHRCRAHMDPPDDLGGDVAAAAGAPTVPAAADCTAPAAAVGGTAAAAAKGGTAAGKTAGSSAGPAGTAARRLLLWILQTTGMPCMCRWMMVGGVVCELEALIGRWWPANTVFLPSAPARPHPGFNRDRY